MENDDINLDTITINLNDTYGTTTTYLNNSTMNSVSGNSYSVTSGASYDTITISDGTYTLNSNSTDWIISDTINITGLTSAFDTYYNESEIEQMCKQYPALEKVWRNFKSVYDMVKQDFEGKKKAGEV